MPPVAKKPVPPYVMPVPPAMVVWRNAPGGEPNYAAVTRLGKSAISVMIFAPESRVGTPKDGVRHISDPLNANQGLSDSGVWEFTEESKQLRILQDRFVPGPDGSVKPMPHETK